MTEPAIVHFRSARTPSPTVAKCAAEHWPHESLVARTVQAFEAACADVIHPGDVVAVKTHLGERYSERYLRPTYARHLVDAIKHLGGRPFLTDTLLRGSEHATGVWTRRGLHDALDTAARNGFTSETIGAPIIFADSVRKTDGVPVRVGGQLIETAYVAPLLADADALISLAHFKGHDCAAFGGQMKALGVGCQSKRGKFWMHCETKPMVDAARCDGCGQCLSACEAGAIALFANGAGPKARIDEPRCVECERCIFACPSKAISAKFAPLGTGLCARIGEGAAGVVRLIGPERCGFINVAIDISPLCDCDPFTDVPFVQDIGVFASKNPVACDRAAVDFVTAMPGLPDSMAEDVGVMGRGDEKLNAIARARWLQTPGATSQAPDWRVMLSAGERVGLGTQRYRLSAPAGSIPARVQDWLLSGLGECASACAGVCEPAEAQAIRS
jgi:hypothetical protein